MKIWNNFLSKYIFIAVILSFLLVILTLFIFNLNVEKTTNVVLEVDQNKNISIKLETSNISVINETKKLYVELENQKFLIENPNFVYVGNNNYLINFENNELYHLIKTNSSYHSKIILGHKKLFNLIFNI